MTDHPPTSQPDPAHAESLIQDTETLARVVARCREFQAVAVDTEFVWTSTFYPRLGLIQLAVSPEEAWLVDGVELADLSALGPLLTDDRVAKVFHDPEMDLPILVRSVGCQPTNVFDTRLTAGFAGFPGTLSLARLIEEFFGIDLPKTQTRTDWCRRPLTPHQLAYALDDVRYMPKLRELLLDRVREHGNEAWLMEEMARYDRPEQIALPDPDEMFRSVKGMGKLPPAQLVVLQKIVGWRERAARRLDLPRRRVLSDEACIALAQKQPQDAEAVARMKCVARRTASDCAAEVAAAIVEGLAVPKSDWPRFRGCPLPQKELKAHADAILTAVREAAENRAIDPAMVTSRKDVNNLVLDQARGKADAAHGLRQGWRAELLGDTLDPLLEAVPVRR